MTVIQEQMPAANAALAMVAAPLEQIDTLTTGAFVKFQNAVAERAQNVAANWDEMSSWRRAAYRAGTLITSAAGLTVLWQGMRMTGAAAHGLESTGVFDGFSGLHPSAGGTAPAAFESHAPANIAVAEHTPPKAGPVITLEAFLKPNDDDKAKLPADVDTAPAPEPIGPYHPKTGAGTVWNEAVNYADKLGYGKLNEHQKWLATNEWLKENHKTWSEARHLSSNYAPHAPTQRVMEHILDQAHAHRTHSPDRAVVVAPHGDPGNPDRGGNNNAADRNDTGGLLNKDPGSSAVTSPAGQSLWDKVIANDCNWPDWWPATLLEDNTFHDCEWNAKDAWLGIGLVGVLGVTYGGQRALNKGKRARTVGGGSGTGRKLFTGATIATLIGRARRKKRKTVPAP
jgi:hypothetical protein